MPARNLLVNVVMTPWSSGRPTILLVDDDDDLRATLGEGLTEEGYNVDALGDGAQAFAYLGEVADGSRECPDLLIVDFCMPGLSGIGVVKLLRDLPERPPAIVMTGFPDGSLERLARSAGAARLMRKPIALLDLLDAVLATLRSAPGPRARESGPHDRHG